MLMDQMQAAEASGQLVHGLRPDIQVIANALDRYCHAAIRTPARSSGPAEFSVAAVTGQEKLNLKDVDWQVIATLLLADFLQND